MKETANGRPILIVGICACRHNADCDKPSDIFMIFVGAALLVLCAMYVVSTLYTSSYKSCITVYLLQEEA